MELASGLESKDEIMQPKTPLHRSWQVTATQMMSQTAIGEQRADSLLIGLYDETGTMEDGAVEAP